MNKILTVILFSLSSFLYAADCEFNFTEEQDQILKMAYGIGSIDNIGYALAAIAWKEGFVGQYIIRVNTEDGKYGSYGVTHVLLSTAIFLTEEKSFWRARAELIPKMINDDIFMINLSKEYLMNHKHLGYQKMISRYNGFGPKANEYAAEVIMRVHKLEKCDYFGEKNES